MNKNTYLIRARCATNAILYPLVYHYKTFDPEYFVVLLKLTCITNFKKRAGIDVDDKMYTFDLVSLLNTEVIADGEITDFKP
jgi:hypothetical protein